MLVSKVAHASPLSVNNRRPTVTSAVTAGDSVKAPSEPSTFNGVERLASAWKISRMNDNLLSRFLRYVQIDTQSDETSKSFPSTPGQLVLLEMLKQELAELGASEVQMTRHGYVMASIPAKTHKRR